MEDFFGNITKSVVDTSEELQKVITEFYDVEGENFTSFDGLVDLKEWFDNSPDDYIFGIKLFNGSVYILQKTSVGKVILKIISPNKTYLYNLQGFPEAFAYGSYSPYAGFEILDEDIIIFHNLYIDLNSLIFVLYEPEIIVSHDFLYNMRDYLPKQMSVVKINNMNWVSVNANYNKGIKKRITFYQRTSILDCISCKDKKRIMEAIGRDDRYSLIECKEEEVSKIRAYKVPEDSSFKCDNTDLKSLKITTGISDNQKAFDRNKDAFKCLRAIKEISSGLNTTVYTNETANKYKDFVKYCNKSFMILLVDYIVLSHKASYLYKEFSKNYYKDKIDYDTFFNSLFSLTPVIAKIVINISNATEDSGLKDDFNKIKVLKSFLSKSYIWGILYFKLNFFRIQQEHKTDGKWNKFNPYSLLLDVDKDNFWRSVIASSKGLETNADFSFTLKHITMSKLKNFQEEATFVSMGPIGCLSKITLPDIDKEEFDVLCEVEKRGDNILLWTWKEINGDPANTYVDNTIHPEKYIFKVFKLDLQAKKLILLASQEVAEDFHCLDHRKIAVGMNDNKDFIFRDYYLSEYNVRDGVYKIDFIESKKITSKGFKYLNAHTRGTLINTNLENVRWDIGFRINRSPSPGFPKSKFGTKDLSDKNLRILGDW